MKVIRMRNIIFLGIIVLLQACSSSAVKESRPSVTSSPSGAAVYANGLKLGVTPLKKDLFKVFPTSWNNWKLSASGVLVLKKQGCKDYTLKVNDAILLKPVHAKLKCGLKPVMSEEAPSPPPQAVTPQKLPVKKKMSKLEMRLNELTRLYKKGVITDQEYRSTRKRILDEI